MNNIRKYIALAAKILCIGLLFYVFTAGFYAQVPQLPILNESIRLLYFHVPMWFGMIVLLGIASYRAICCLRNPSPRRDLEVLSFTQMGMFFGLMGLLTGMIWAQNTWGEAWSNDPKQNASALGLLLYLAYFTLRQTLSADQEQRMRWSAAYNVFCFLSLIPLLFILPRLTDSLHPGSGGNPGFDTYDLDASLRKVFYPALVGWILLGVWIANLLIRIGEIQKKS
ncbi:MAG: cytochrome c biogenesis protein CcsA [Cytophagales bacterium]|nr:cytochrome c biogenesis protein CcsA [Cytophagales bacterium]